LDRNYIAFISYRHRPLDMAVAKALHKRIERYVIPRDLRRDGQKKLGLVFRDQEELPIASNLTENIETALRHARYLIVVCTPDTPQSMWVRREIATFIAMHGRDRVLAILADGDPDSAFPPELTDVTDASGQVVDRIEPLAANIANTSGLRRRRLFQTESLRILASLIGCPFDALYRREQRYRMRRLAAAGAVTLAILGGFIGMLLNRNAVIHNQLLRTQENESRVLVQLSERALREGQYHEAVASATEALCGPGNERPYVPEAELQLSQVLLPYRTGFRPDQSVQTATAVNRLVLTSDGKKLLTADAYGLIQCHDAHSAALSWERRVPGSVDFPTELYLSASESFVFFRRGESLGALSLTDGETLWTEEKSEGFLRGFDPATGRYALLDPQRGVCALWSAEDHRLIAEISLADAGISCENAAAFLDSGVLSPDGQTLLFSVTDIYFSKESLIVLWDLRAASVTVLDRIPLESVFAPSFRFSYGEDGTLLAAYDLAGTGGEVRAYGSDPGHRRLWTATLDAAEDAAVRLVNGSETGVMLLTQTDGSVLVGLRDRLLCLNGGDGSEIWRRTLSGDLLASLVPASGKRVALLLDNGLMTAVSPATGALGTDVGIGAYDAQMECAAGALCGSTLEDMTFALVPTLHRDCVTLIKSAVPEDLTPLTDDAPTFPDCSWCASPSGEAFAALRFRADSHELEVRWFNAACEEKTYTLPCPENLYFGTADALLTEDRKLILGGYCFDLEEGTAQALFDGDGTLPEGAILSLWDSVSVLNSTRGEILSLGLAVGNDAESTPFCRLSVLSDGDEVLKEWTLRSTEDLDLNELRPAAWGVGGNGNVLLAWAGPEDWYQDAAETDRLYVAFRPEADEPIVLPFSRCRQFALGEASELLAAVTENGLCLYDLKTGQAVRTLETETPETVEKLLFADKDRYLLVFTRQGEIRLFETESGALLGKSDFSADGMRFTQAQRVRVFTVPEDSRLFIGCAGGGYANGFLFLLDGNSGECVGAFNSVLSLIPSRKLLLTQVPYDRVYTAPLYDTVSLRALALRFLEREPE